MYKTLAEIKRDLQKGRYKHYKMSEREDIYIYGEIPEK